ncbi:minor capsid protein [Enterococcus sp. AZ109]|uniref:minor capsid protein n=1 Tax=Enterococcus sp. AZ109 TaxID=2774634 RepID=UPI003F1EA775
MLGLAEVRDWLKTFNIGKNFYIGKLDNKQDESIGVYQRKTEQQPRFAIGGRELASYDKKSVSVLIHWNKNARDTEDIAQQLYSAILNSKSVVINKKSIQYIQLLSNEPIDVGTDDTGVYEWVIQFDLFYTLKESE